MTETLEPNLAEVQELLVEFIAPPDQSSHADILAQGYEYTHTDGTVYHAENAERARAICPVLGEMALNEVDLLLEIAAIGQQKLDQERSKEVDKQPEPQKLKPEKSVSENVAKDTKSEVASQIATEGLAAKAKLNGAVTPVADNKPLPSMVGEETNKHSAKSIETPLIRDAEQENAQARYHATYPDVEQVFADAVEVEVEVIMSPLVDKSGSSEETAASKSTRRSVTNSQKLAVAPAEEFMEAPAESETHGAILAAGEARLPVALIEVDDEFEKFITLTTPEVEIAEEAEITAGKLPSVHSNEQTTWGHELEEDPEEIYKNFAKALYTLISLPADESFIEANKQVAINDELADENEAYAEQSKLAMVAKVAERLSKLAVEERDMAIKHVTSVVETLQIMNTLEAQDVKVAQVKLEELIADLFEQLGVEYGTDDIEQFISVLLRPDFQPPQPKMLQNKVDLERDGTHEAKRNFSQVVSDAAEEIERDIMLLIGTLALFRVMNRQAI